MAMLIPHHEMEELKTIYVRAVDLERLGVHIAHWTGDDPEIRQQCHDNAKKIARMFNPKPIPTHGPCLICGTDTTILRGDGYGPGVFCCHGPGCIPF